MSAVIETFEKNDLRKSNRTHIEGTVSIHGEEYRVADWSFSGFRIQEISISSEEQDNEFQDINFAVHYGAFDINFRAKARLIWASESAAGFEWNHLPLHVRSMFKEYLRTKRECNPPAKLLYHDETLFLTPTKIDPLHEPKLEENLKKQRRVHIKLYYVIALCVLALLALLKYENEFTYSVRAIYPGNLNVVNSTVEGEILDVLVKPGDNIKKGDIIATIDSTDLKQQLSAAQQLVKQRKLAVAVGERAVQFTLEPKSIYTSVAEQQLAAAKANVAQAQAVLNAKESDFQRMTELSKRGLIGGSELDRIRADKDSASAHLQALVEEKRLADKVLQEARLGRYFNGSRVNNDAQVIEVNLAQRQAELAQAELDLSIMQTQQNHTQIKAMGSGKIFSINIMPGTFVKRGDSVGVIEYKSQQLNVVGNFKIDDLKYLTPSDHAYVYFRETNQTINAKIVSLGQTRLARNYPLAAMLNSVDGEAPVEFELEHLPNDYYAGMPVEIKVKSKSSGFGVF